VLDERLTANDTRMEQID